MEVARARYILLLLLHNSDTSVKLREWQIGAKNVELFNSASEQDCSRKYQFLSLDLKTEEFKIKSWDNTKQLLEDKDSGQSEKISE